MSLVSLDQSCTVLQDNMLFFVCLFVCLFVCFLSHFQPLSHVKLFFNNGFLSEDPPTSPKSGIQRPGRMFNACSVFYLRL